MLSAELVQILAESKEKEALGVRCCTTVYVLHSQGIGAGRQLRIPTMKNLKVRSPISTLKCVFAGNMSKLRSSLVLQPDQNDEEEYQNK